MEERFHPRREFTNSDCFLIFVVMKQNKTYIITGATGFLGQKLVRAFVKAGDDVVLIVRGGAGVSASSRIDTLFDFNKEEQKQVRVIDSDLENIDIAQEIEDFVAVSNLKIDGIWHLAANLSFRSKDRESVNNVNFIGTQRLVKLAKKLNVPLFYVSTAYVHGQRDGALKEDELLSTRFNNAYEESKFMTERYLKAERENGLRYIVFRPAILIDIDDNASSMHSPFGYYSILQLMHSLVLSLRNFIGEHKIIASILGLRIDTSEILHSYYLPFLVTKTTLNLVPVDVAVATMVRIINNSTNFQYDTFHIVSPVALSMRKIAKVTFDELKMKANIVELPRFVMRGIFMVIYFLSKLFTGLVGISKKLHQYGYYMTKTYHFDTIQTEQVYGKHEYTSLFSNSTEDLRYAARVFIGKQKSLKEKSL
ncbi:MAG: hypothetical protein UW17_C0010G0010 [Candidatus Nomurabacteria bacterium GW2011_GWD1_44_10]|nr:MAG: hypothetical protein UW17_C0010G0010 [Candidatus Nomurabacteria bacterium GW2011_GWD1_44_10]